MPAGPSSPEAGLSQSLRGGGGGGGPGGTACGGRGSHAPEAAAPWLTWEVPTVPGTSISAPTSLLLAPGSAGWCAHALLFLSAEGEPTWARSHGARLGSPGPVFASAPSVTAGHTREAESERAPWGRGPHLPPARPWKPHRPRPERPPREGSEKPNFNRASAQNGC